MKRLSLRLFLPLLLMLNVAGSALAADGSYRFGSDEIIGWEVRSFKGNTDYRLVEEAGRRVLQAKARGTASGLVRKITFDPREYRYLRWSWKIEGTVAGGDARTQKGDDYAARVYVVFPGRFFWQTKALNYVWANRLPQGEFTPNAFTANARLLAVQSGAAKAGQWLDERRDLVADYRRLFGEEPPMAGALAIMTDADNTGATATAWYGDIILSKSP
ncbi:MAG: DUF3047 domain-containing protein [Desulfuromonadales bacterium]|nr:DUF3047 domain-containing protein [Desulfuromonadales bacterium]MDW7757423.1 DUF3047 domain-containing protein [Desulfuromonadales bacterium]